MDSNTIPLNLFQYWHSTDIPPKMKIAIEKLKLASPEFNYKLFDENSALQFINENFTEDVLNSFKKLKPCAYKSDLFRYCYLYINGGIYVDVKLEPLDNFKLIELIHREHFVKDYTACNNNNAGNISQTIMICCKNSKLLLECIRRIVINIQNNFYGTSCLLITGPGLLAKVYRDIKYDNDYIDMLHLGFNFCIKYNNKLIFESYPEYRKEQKIYQKSPYYVDLWQNGDIYNY